jgi:hypothetical protein
LILVIPFPIKKINQLPLSAVFLFPYESLKNRLVSMHDYTGITQTISQNSSGRPAPVVVFENFDLDGEGLPVKPIRLSVALS